MNGKGLVLVLAALLGLAGCATDGQSRLYPYGVFDAPAKIETKKLPKDPLNPQMKPHITCTRYAGFAVKEVDLGEKGAQKLAIMPTAAPCSVDTPGEIAVGELPWGVATQ